MLIYQFSLAAIVVTYPFINKMQTRRKKELYIVLISIWLILLLALRDTSIGCDLGNYLPWYTLFGQTPWGKLSYLSAARECEIGYVILNKLLFYLNTSPRMIMAATGIIAVSAIGFSVYRNSKMPWMSFWIYVTLGFYRYPFSALRQAIAMALILFGYEYIKKNDFRKFLLITLLAATFHKTALCVIPLYFLKKVKIEKHYLGLLAALDIVILLFGKKILTMLAKLVHYESYIKKIGSGNGLGILLIHIAILFLMLIVAKYKTSQELNIYIHTLLVAITLNILALHMGVADRVMFYYDLILPFSLPNVVCCIKGRQMRKILYAGIMAGTFAYYLFIICRADNMSVIPYKFCF